MRLRGGLICLTVMMGLGTVMLGAVDPRTVFELSTLVISPPAFAQDGEEATNIRVYQQASPAVVSIQTEENIGSGTIVSPNGLVLTASHVVKNFQTVTVLLANGSKLQADVVGFAEAGTDLAALQIRGQQTLPAISIARPESVLVGQRVFAIGNPFGQFEGTFTSGVISRINMDQGLIQTDTVISPGDSGGPLLNRNGELIGVIVAPFNLGQAISNNGIGFAISVEQVEALLTAVREGQAPRTMQNPLAQNAQSIEPNGQLIDGELTESSNILPSDNSYFNAYRFEGKAGQQILIEMTSRNFDAYLILISPEATDTIQSDYRGGRTAASTVSITTVLPKDGTYLVLTNSANPGATGRYNLRVMIEGGASYYLGD